MAKVVLTCVAAPTLLIVGERDETVRGMESRVVCGTSLRKGLEIVPRQRIF